MNNTNLTGNHQRTQQQIRYVSREKGSHALYEQLGFRCGLEVHQQLRTEKKLFCRCPASRSLLLVDAMSTRLE
jgi:glutamyl-tRNA(Gln) amidotransferase subunit E